MKKKLKRYIVCDICEEDIGDPEYYDTYNSALEEAFRRLANNHYKIHHIWNYEPYVSIVLENFINNHELPDFTETVADFYYSVENALRRVNEKEELNDAAVYYSDEYIKVGNRQFKFIRLYDKNFDIVEDVDITHANLLKEMRKIIDEPKYDVTTAYHIDQNDHTKRALESAIKIKTKERRWNV